MGGVNSAPAKGKTAVAAHLTAAERSGTLDLSDQDLKASSQVWDKISSQGLSALLITLDISGNTLKYLPWEILQMTQLGVLHASRCNIQRTYDMSPMPQLTTLNIDNNDLEADCLDALPGQLRRLNLCNNHFQSVPHAGLSVLLELTELNLSGNRLETTEGLGVLVSLVDLNLDNNRLQGLCADLHLCVQLKHLSLRSNRLRGDLPTEAASASASGGDDIEGEGEGERGQAVPHQILTGTLLSDLALHGNPQLSSVTVSSWRGINVFLERRRRAQRGSRSPSLGGGGGGDSPSCGVAGDEMNLFGGMT